MTLLTLPSHVLFKILDHLDERQLISSRRTSREWRNLVDDDVLWRKKFRRLSRHNPRWTDRSWYAWKTRYFYARKWLRGNVTGRRLVDFGKKYIPWLRLCPIDQKEHIWFTMGSEIHRISLNDSRTDKQRFGTIFAGQLRNDDFCRFTFSPSSPGDNGLWLASGTRSGLLYYLYWIPQSDVPGRDQHEHCVYWGCFQAHDSDLHCVDLSRRSGLAITGSRDRTVKIWNVPALTNDSDGRPSLKSTLALDDRAWCLELNRHHENQLAVGSAACWNNCAPISLWDIERGTLTMQLGLPCKRGAGILDLCFTSEHTLLSAGYDSTVRLWDSRTRDKCVWSWDETYDSSIYCLSSDNGHSIFAGTSRYGLVWLLDTRRRSAMQNYYVGTSNGPVYSLAATTGNLHVCLESELWTVQCGVNAKG